MNYLTGLSQIMNFKWETHRDLVLIGKGLILTTGSPIDTNDNEPGI